MNGIKGMMGVGEWAIDWLKRFSVCLLPPFPENHVSLAFKQSTPQAKTVTKGEAMEKQNRPNRGRVGNQAKKAYQELRVVREL